MKCPSCRQGKIYESLCKVDYKYKGVVTPVYVRGKVCRNCSSVVLSKKESSLFDLAISRAAEYLNEGKDNGSE